MNVLFASSVIIVLYSNGKLQYVYWTKLHLLRSSVGVGVFSVHYFQYFALLPYRRTS